MTFVFQLLQVEKLQEKADGAETEEARRQYESIVKRAKEMAESIKHAIVVLQIAKNATLPQEVNAIKDFTSAAAAAAVVAMSPIRRPADTDDSIETGIALGKECVEVAPAKNKNIMGLTSSSAAAAVAVPATLKKTGNG